MGGVRIYASSGPTSVDAGKLPLRGQAPCKGAYNLAVGNAHGPSDRRNGSGPESVRPTPYPNPSFAFFFSTKDRANVIRPDVESELIQFLRKHGVEYDERYIWR